MFVPPNKHGFVFSWDHCKSQEKLETMLMQNLGGQTEYYGIFWSGLLLPLALQQQQFIVLVPKMEKLRTTENLH